MCIIQSSQLAVLKGNLQSPIVLGCCYAAEDLRCAFSEMQIAYNQNRISSTISIVVASFPIYSGTPEKLVQMADNALFSAKRNGRNRVAPAENKPDPTRVHDR